MALPNWKCEVCGKKFTVGEWTCQDGQSNHVVPNKEYLSVDAPSDPGHAAIGGQDALRDGRTRVCNVPPDKNVVVNGEVRLQPGGYVEFIRGRFSSSDPEIQYYLDKKPAYNFSEKEWQAAWLSTSQRQQLKEMDLAAREQRLENEQNALLAQTKERVGARA